MSGVTNVLAARPINSTSILTDNRTVTSEVEFGTAIAGYQLNSDGYLYITEGFGPSQEGLWVTPFTAGGSYEVLATVLSGTLSTGTAGSWLATSTSPEWTRQRSTSGTSTCVLLLQFRAAGQTAIMWTYTITLTARRVI